MYEAMVGLLMLPFVYWTFICIAVVLLIVASEIQSLTLVFWVLVFAITFLFLEGNTLHSVIQYITDHPIIILFILLLYVMIGIVWSLFKWYLHLKDLVHDKTSTKYYTDKRKTYLDEHKDMIVTWIILWPPSMLWFLVNDPIRRFGNWIYEKMRGIYQALTDRMFDRLNPK